MTFVSIVYKFAYFTLEMQSKVAAWPQTTPSPPAITDAQVTTTTTTTTVTAPTVTMTSSLGTTSTQTLITQPPDMSPSIFSDIKAINLNFGE